MHQNFFKFKNRRKFTFYKTLLFDIFMGVTVYMKKGVIICKSFHDDIRSGYYHCGLVQFDQNHSILHCSEHYKDHYPVKKRTENHTQRYLYFNCNFLRQYKSFPLL